MKRKQVLWWWSAALVFALVDARTIAASAASPTTAESGAASTPKSLHMKREFHSYFNGKTVPIVTEEWYRSPDTMKTTGKLPDHSSMQMCSGDLYVHYEATGDSKVAVMRPSTAADRQILDRTFERPFLVTPTNAEAALAAYASKYNLVNARITGDKTIAGRKAVIVEGTGYRQPTVMHVEYVDSETGVTLGDRVCDGTNLLRTFEATIFEVNQPIRDDVFKPEFPPGTRVFRGAVAESRLRGIKKGLKDVSELEQELGRSLTCDGNCPVALEAIYRPSYVPSNYKLLGTDACYEPGPPKRWKTDFVNPESGDTIILEQKVVASRTTDWPRLSGEFAGRFTAHKTPYAYSELEWNAPGTEPAQFTLTASGLEKEELLKIARSMTPSAGAARWLGKRNSWRLAARVMGNSAPDKLGAAVTVIRKRVTFIFGPAAKAEPEGADGITISASSNNPDMRALLIPAATMPGHIRLVELPLGTKVGLDHTADAHKVTAPDGTPLLETQVLKLPGTVLDEKELAFTRYPYPDGSIWGKIEIVAASRDKAARYAESHPGYALAVVLDGSMVLGYVPPEFLAHDFPRQVAMVGERGWLWEAILESGPLPARVEAQPAEGKSAE